MSILISAPIRTGKTLKVIECIFQELNKGRLVYTNIIGIKIPGVFSVSSSINEPFDWRDLPNGSVLVWDEAHEHPAFSEKDLLKDFKIDETEYDSEIEEISSKNLAVTEKKRLIDLVEKRKKNALSFRKQQIRDIGEGLLLHGHFGIEIYFITQRPNKLNADLLASVTTHFVMRRKFGMDAAMIWEFGEAMTSWSKSTAEIALNKMLWRYPKHLYKFYTSSESHQVRKSFPAKYFAFLLLPIALFYYGFSSATETGFFGIFGKKEQTVEETTNQNHNSSTATENKNALPVEAQSPFNTELPTDPFEAEKKRIASVFLSGDKCNAYTGDGNYIKLPYTYCKELSDNPRLLQAAAHEVKEQRLQAVNYQQQQQSNEPTQGL